MDKSSEDLLNTNIVLVTSMHVIIKTQNWIQALNLAIDYHTVPLTLASPDRLKLANALKVWSLKISY